MARNTRLKLFVHLCLIAALLAACRTGKSSYETTVSAAEGGQVAFENIQIVVPPGAVTADTRVSVDRVDDPPPLVTQALVDQGVDAADYVMVSDVYDIDFGQAALTKPVVIMVRYDPGSIPGGRAPGDLKIAQYRDGEWGVLETAFDPATHMLRAETDHFSLTAVVVAVMILGITGWAALTWVANQKRSLTDPKYLEPDKVDVSGFNVDLADHRLTLDKPLTVVDRGSGVTPKAASVMQLEQRPSGMCIDFSNLFGSLLIKKGYPVRIVSGTATYTTKDGQVKGGHLWVETVIDGQPYYVDTFSANESVDLVPLEDANSRFNLERGKVFWKEMKGGQYVTQTQETYDRDWWTTVASSPALPQTAKPAAAAATEAPKPTEAARPAATVSVPQMPVDYQALPAQCEWGRGNRSGGDPG